MLRSVHTQKSCSGKSAEQTCLEKSITDAGNRNILVRASSSSTTITKQTHSDDTSVAILEKHDAHVDPLSSSEPRPAATLHFHEKITADNSRHGGIHPITSLDSHQENLARLINKALHDLPDVLHDATPSPPTITVTLPSGRTATKRKPDFISVTRGPGMRSSLSTGLDTAKGLATAWQIPFLGINHMQAHALTPRLVSALNSPSTHPSPAFPFLSLLVSGGHTLLLHSTSSTQHSSLAATTDIALGDCIDKIARAILPPSPLPTGPLLETFAFPSHPPCYAYTAPPSRALELARLPTPYAWTLSPPLAETRGGRKSRSMEYSFSGLDSACRRIATGIPAADEPQRRHLAREAMRVAFEHLASRVVMALSTLENEARDRVPRSDGPELPLAGRDSDSRLDTLVLSGGVAANGFLRAVYVAPSPSLPCRALL
ncbi:hypothetical protein MMC13_007704 [Lambiella insularis]|nr:hypothetical protein [Lambiella insularis]